MSEEKIFLFRSKGTVFCKQFTWSITMDTKKFKSFLNHLQLNSIYRGAVYGLFKAFVKNVEVIPIDKFLIEAKDFEEGSIFEITALTQIELQNKVDEQLKEILKYGPLPENKLSKFDVFLQVEMSYTSTALENFKLTRSETESVVSGLLQIDRKTLHDLLAVADHVEAVKIMIAMLRKNEGVYRCDLPSVHDQTVFVTTSTVQFPSPEEVSIHPWRDGNGRATRLLMNMILMKFGYGIASIPFEIKDEYMDAVKSAQLTGIKTDWEEAVTRDTTTPGSDKLHRIVLEAVSQTGDFLLELAME